ncbi:MAG TPA: GNAT family N-acetyltransferase [Rhodocyclaceae bacterium]|nr:GNAT family N-acetyltransferase [Rhodocyclaceae bacterium]
MHTQHYLTSLFAPQSIAVIGATERERSVGAVIFGNILKSGYKGRLFAVNPRRETVQGQKAWPSVEDIGGRIDLAIIATPARTIPVIMEQCGRAGVRYAIILAAGFSETGNSGAVLERRVREIARAGGVRILGPNCIGIMRPDQKLNAAVTRISAQPGDLALVSQSGAMCSAVLDWAATNNVGFSSVISLGGTADIDFGEILDYLVYDDKTRHILIYVEHIRNARRFMSALRSAARVKPVMLLKAGRHQARAGEGAEALADEVFDAAVRRAGVVRVQNIEQLFHAAKALSSGFRPRGRQLAIITNGGGPGAMAADRAGDLGIPLAPLTSDTVDALNRLLPRGWSHDGLIDIGGDATPERYGNALLAVANDPNVHSTLVLLAPHAMTEPVEIAQAIRDAAAKVAFPVCCCWMGGGQVAEARRLLEDAGLPVFPTPDTVIELFHNIAKYHRNQKLLVQTPGPLRKPRESRAGSARMLIETLLAERRKILSVMESKAVLRAFGVPVSQTMVAHSATEALFIAEQVGFPVAMKIDSPDLARKSEAGGVRLNVASTESVWSAYQDIVEAVKKRFPEARINGVSIEPHLERPNSRELMIGAFRDPVFGPVITFGAGGENGDIVSDRALALPPLNGFLARDLIDSTQVGRALGQHRHQLPQDTSALEKVLVSVSELLCELPWVKELEINPLLMDEAGPIAADARIVIDSALGRERERYGHLAIYPYPTSLVQEWQLEGRTVTVRPVRPEDAPLEQEFVRSMSEESRRFRFMDSTTELPPTLLARFTQIDYNREMALIATVHEDGKDREIGSARYALSPDGESVEFALAVADELQRCGLGRRLMAMLMDCARQSGYRAMVGDVLTDNAKMLGLVESLGFSILPHPEDRSAKRVVKSLAD